MSFYALPDTCKLGLTEAQAYAVVWDAFQKIQEEASRAMVFIPYFKLVSFRLQIYNYFVRLYLE